MFREYVFSIRVMQYFIITKNSAIFIFKMIKSRILFGGCSQNTFKILTAKYTRKKPPRKA